MGFMPSMEAVVGQNFTELSAPPVLVFPYQGYAADFVVCLPLLAHAGYIMLQIWPDLQRFHT